MTRENTMLPLESKEFCASKGFIRLYILITLIALVFVSPTADGSIDNRVSLPNKRETKKKKKKTKTNPKSTDTEFFYPNITPNMTQDLIDFSVPGFPKCGTTFLLRGILGASQHIYMGAKDENGWYTEMHQLARGNLTGFLSYFQSNNVSSVKRGFKNPVALISEPILYHMSTYFPKIKMIVSIRHPITWFESLYNYRIRSTQGRRYANVTAHNRIGECKRSPKRYVCTSQHQPCITYEPGFGCTDWANYHVHLSRLGWTPRNSHRELNLLHHRLENTFNFSQSKLFLMETNQLDSRKNMSSANALIHDLESFLELDPGSLPTFDTIPDDPHTTNHVDESEINENVLKRFISICDDQYGDLRQILLQQAVYVIYVFIRYLVSKI